MVVRNVVKEEEPNPSQERSVDGGDCTMEEGPLLVTEVGDGWIGVVEVREHDDPVVGQLQSGFIDESRKDDGTKRTR
jgi:hypothetical protein